MSDIPIDIALSVIGIAVAVAAFLREFVFVGRKHLGYRVQMNTPVSRIPLMVPNGSDMTMVLIRIENDGGTVIDDDDYRPADRPSLIFPGHSVQATEVTERVTRSGERRAHDHFSSELRAIETSTTAQGQGRIVLPREILQRGEHYKVLALLQAQGADPITDDREIVVHGGSLKGGSIDMTTTRSRREPLLLGFSLFLAVVFVVQLIYAVVQPDPPPKDCAAGQLTLIGSTAMAPMIRSAAQSYQRVCREARFEFDFQGTTDGHDKLAEPAPAPNTVSIGEGPKLDTYPTLSERAFAVAPYSVVLHRDLPVDTLTVQQVRDLYAGRLANWSDVGGPDLPVTLVDRRVGSGTKNAFDWRLGITGRRSEATISCLGMPSDLSHCLVGSAAEMIDVVARTPGAIGYSETAAVTDTVRAIELGGVRATKDNVLSHVYPFYSVEYALTDYPDGSIPADSLAANFIDYLVNGRGKLIVEEFGAAVCANLPDPMTCEP
ncbi:substrate-binding domain-containing protein [Nocardia sp. NPDC058633]|uniref:substrate-binding domain-containing protein n=1 Tax=Nocardia sp. NPDC058633 TaxID=3346568 RepID=UPI00366044DA